MSSERESKDELEVVPITEQIEARVNEAVEDATRRPPSTPPPPEPPPLELGEIEPLPGPWDGPPRRFYWKRAIAGTMKWFAALAVIALAAGAFLTLTDTGRRLLPASMQKDARKIARDVERRAKSVNEEVFYTYTDDRGVVHIVDHLEKVPRKYRARAQKKR